MTIDDGDARANAEEATEAGAPAAASEEMLDTVHVDRDQPGGDVQDVQYGYFGFTLREVLIVGVWLLLFVISFFPLAPGQASIWGVGLHWLLPIGVPTVAVFLIVLRRLSPQGIRRVGSLGIDQFASIAFAVGFAYWLPLIGDAIARLVAVGIGSSWVMWTSAVLLLALIALTVFAPLIPGIRDDFEGRPTQQAHRAAAPVRPVVARPVAERAERVEEVAPVATAPVAPQPFWALAPTERDVVDEESGEALFRIGPTAWALVIEEDATSFLVRHEDGRVGRLYDITDITRG